MMMLFNCWFLLIVIISFMSFKNNMFLFFLFLFSLVSSSMFSIMNSSWVSMIFFLVYIGALLVLFFYLFSLTPNPLVLYSGLKSLLLVFLFLFCLNWFFCFKFLYIKYKNFFSKKLFKPMDFSYLSLMIFFLFFFLWVMSKLSMFQISALRPYY